MSLIINSVDEDTNITSELNSIVLFDINKFILKNIDSYKSCPISILKQFELDFPRSSIYVDDTRIISIQEFMNYFSFLSTIKINSIMGNIIFAMICNQSTYATPYFFLSNVFKDMILFSDDKNRYIKFSNEYDNLIIDINGQFKVYNPIEDMHIGIVKFNMMIQTNIIKNKYWLYFLYDVYSIPKEIFNDNIILTWSFQAQDPNS